jgi:hypothetical protein
MSGLTNTLTYYKNLSINLQKCINNLHQQRSKNKENTIKLIQRTNYEINNLRQQLNEKNNIISLLREEILDKNSTKDLVQDLLKGLVRESSKDLEQYLLKDLEHESTKDLEQVLEQDSEKVLEQDSTKVLEQVSGQDSAEDFYKYDNEFISIHNGIKYLFTFDDFGNLCVKDQL